jgi:hypothetical protein
VALTDGRGVGWVHVAARHAHGTVGLFGRAGLAETSRPDPGQAVMILPP